MNGDKKKLETLSLTVGAGDTRPKIVYFAYNPT